MTNAPDPFDWSSLGEEPLPGEMADDALLEAVFAGPAVVAAPAPTPAPPRWIRPAVVAAVLLAAAVVLVIVTPSWRSAWLGSDEQGSVAPDVTAPQDDEHAVRKHAKSKATTAHNVRLAPAEPAEPIEPIEPVVASPIVEPQEEAPADAPRRKPSPTPSPDELLRSAQDAFAAKDTSDAIRKYSALVRHHPASPQARTARVSLGRLQLTAGRAKKALAQFDRYLEGPGGGLRQEAELGRIDALRKLGRSDAQKQAIEAFLEAHPNTVHAGRLRRQLEALP